MDLLSASRRRHHEELAAFPSSQRRGGATAYRSCRAGSEARARAKRKRDSAQPQEMGEASINGQFGEIYGMPV